MNDIASPIVTVERSVLALLHRIGAQTRTELHSTVTGMNKATITKLIERGLVRHDKADSERISITGAGLRSIGAASTKVPLKPKAKEKSQWYQGEELLPFDGRPGAMDAFALPSRRSDGLHYPSGRVHTAGSSS
jgi:hypothetical protein